MTLFDRLQNLRNGGGITNENEGILDIIGQRIQEAQSSRPLNKLLSSGGVIDRAISIRNSSLASTPGISESRINQNQVPKKKEEQMHGDPVENYNYNDEQDHLLGTTYVNKKIKFQ